MKTVKAIFEYGIVIATLLLSIWSQSWVLIIIVFITSALLWHPQFRVPFSFLKKKLTTLQYVILEWMLAISIAFFGVWFASNYFISVFTIGSTSMQPAYNSGQLIVIDKMAYGPAVNINKCKRYRRLKGYSKIKVGDVIAFHFPEADTAFEEHSKEDYYFIKRQYESTQSYNPILEGKVVYNRVSERKAFIKRIIALPGDTLTIKNGTYIINNQPIHCNGIFVSKYKIKKNIPASIKEDILRSALTSYRERGSQFVELQTNIVNSKQWNKYLIQMEDPLNMPNIHVFPFNTSYFWNASYIGPIILPTKGKTVQLTLSNLPLYKRIIESYEENKLQTVGNRILINGKQTNEYTFKLNYYWVAGDNKTHSFDSRYWGFVPENHIIGKAQRLAGK